MAKRGGSVTKQALWKHVLIDGMVTELLPFGLGGAGDPEYRSGAPSPVGKKVTQIINYPTMKQVQAKREREVACKKRVRKGVLELNLSG